MAEFCTCGTQLVENSRFCHRCGRPTHEDAVAVAEVVEPTAPQPPPLPTERSLQATLAQLPVNFNNPIALRVAFLMSVAIVPLEIAPYLSTMLVVWWLGAGWFAVALYRKLTGLVLSVRAGARLGTLTGVITFVGLTICFTLLLALDGKELFAQMDESARQMAQQMGQPNSAALQATLTPLMRFFSLVVGLGLMGLVVVGICAAGGALGARFAARKANS